MTVDNTTLGTLFSEIEDQFQHDPEVTIAPGSGDPPSQYELTFHIPCTIKDEAGTIKIGSNHVITLTIPFGFPHFPPSCKPKSPIFHPDFDNAAVCLGDFWGHTPSLSGLIRHLKAMIGGEIYSEENAFNSEAADWFRRNRKDLPFVRNIHTISDQFPDLEGAEAEAELDVVTDSDFADDFTFDDDRLKLQSAEPPMEPVVQPADLGVPTGFYGSYTPSAFDLERFNLLASKRHFQELDAELAALPALADSQEITALAQIAASAMRKASALHQQALRYQQQGEFHKALDRFHQVENHVADFPNILEKIAKLEDQLESMPASPREATSEKEPLEAVIPAYRGETGSPLPPVCEAASGEEQTAPGNNTVKRRNVKLPSLGKPLRYSLAGLMVAAVAAGGYVWYHDNSQLQSGKSLFQQCNVAMDEQQFRSAQQACLQAQAASDSILMLHPADARTLAIKIHAILSSQALQQGLKGNILFNGRYVPKAAVAQHQELLEATAFGTDAFNNAIWIDAAVNLKRAVELDGSLQALSAEEREKIALQTAYAAFMVKLEAVESAFRRGVHSIDSAVLNALGEELDALPDQEAAALRSRVDVILAKYQFSALKQQADALFSKSDWPGAMSLFAKAAETGKLLSETEPPELSDIRKSIARAELYASIDAANQLFAAGRWDEAITKYQQAITLLRDNFQLLNSGEYQHSVDKLERVILQSTIIRDRQAAELLKAEDQLPEAIRKLEEILSNINRSNYRAEPEFSEILTETKSATDTLKKRLFISDRAAYLVENYYSLVKENYAAASEDTISSPAAEFVKQLDATHYLFKLQCTETGRGRPLKLIMYYTYDAESRGWEFSNGG